MERRDPLREMANTSSNNEPQEATDDASKQPEPVISPSSDNDKENGFASKMQIPETDKTDIGCGSYNKPKGTKTRRSILKAFDPLCVDSPEKFQAAPSSKPYQPLREQLVIEDSDESAHTIEVSDEETAFVDACADTDENSRFQDPQNTNLLAYSLINFSSPVQVSVKDSDSDPIPTSDVFESQSVLLNVETSTSSNIEKETICSTSPVPDIIENEIVSEEKEIFSEINKRLSSDCDIIPTRFRFTISESGLENFNLTEDKSSIVESEVPLKGSEENAIGTSSDAGEDTEVAVIEKSSVVETDLKDKEHINESPQEKVYCSIPESESKTSIDEPSISKEIEYVESINFTDDKAGDDVNKSVKEEPLCEVDKPQPEHSETADISEENLEVQSELKLENQESLQKESIDEFHKEKQLVKEFQPETDSLVEDKHIENQEFSNEENSIKTSEKTEKFIGSDCESDFASNQDCKTPQKHIELNSETEVEPDGGHLVSDCQPEFEHQNDIQSDGGQDSKLVKESVTPQNVNLDCETKSKELKEVIEETLECTELYATHKEVEEENSECAELNDTYKKVEEETLEVESVRSSKEEISNKKTEELDTTFESQKSAVPHSEPVTDSDNRTCTPQDEEHHLDSGVDSIEESYTKSPGKKISDSEEIKIREEGQDICSNREDSCLSEERLNNSNDNDIIISADERSLDKDTKVVVDTAQDEQPQLLDNPEIEISKLDETTTTESDKIVNSSADPKSDIKSSLVDIDSLKFKMADLSEKLSEQQQENSDLKLQLNAIQQAKASLELEIRQKEEVIIKTQAEALKNEQTFKQELKQLREKLKENSKLIEKDGSKELEDQLKEAKAREAKAIAELNQRTKDDLNYQKIMEEYENTIATRFADYQKLKEEHETATRHLANIELAFSDVHQKYERTKALLEGFKSNEEALNAALQSSEKTCKQHEERYESLKAHAKGQIEKSNKEILMLRDKYEMDINKLKAIIKRLEIKCSSLEVSLQQKTEECAALSALCDEVTGKKV